MKVLKTLSRTGNFILIFCFFLPFAPIGCGEPSAKEYAEKAKRDSMRVADSVKGHDLHAAAAQGGNVKDTADEVLITRDSIMDAGASMGNDATLPENHPESLKVPEPFWNLVLNSMVQTPNAISGFGFVWVAAALIGEKGSAWYGIAYLLGFVISYFSIVFLAFYALRKRAFSGNLMFCLSLFSLIYFFVFFFTTLSFNEMLYGFWTTLIVWLLNLALIGYISRREMQCDLLSKL